MRLQAKAGYKVTAEEIEAEQRKRQRAGKRLILDYQPEYFASLSVPEALSAGFTHEQIPYITEELKKLGLTFRPEAHTDEQQRIHS